MTEPADVDVPEVDAAASPRRQDEVEAVHSELRRQILHNHLISGSRINQAVIARDLRVSRGPVREALRLLQREGLVEHVHQHQMRVAGVSLSDLEQLYAMRITLEAFSVVVTVPHLTAGEMDELDASIAEMAGHAAAGDGDRWEEVHSRFHQILWSHAGDRIDGELCDLAEYSDRYRRLYVQNEPLAWSEGAKDHLAIMRAVRAGNGALAASRHGQHLGKAALTVAAVVDPSHDPAVVRAAIRQVRVAEPT